MAWPPQFIDKVGIELEGGWDNPPGYDMHGDVSVTVAAPYVGEVSLPPSAPTRALEWMVESDIYPDYGNSSCGLHVHVSTKNLSDYAELTDEAFNKAFLVGMAFWGKNRKVPLGHEFWARLAGQNRFCAKKFDPDTQMLRRPGLDRQTGRRTQLNFCAYSKYGTLECRMLPFFQAASMARSGVKAFLKLVDDYLESRQEVAQPEFKLEVTNRKLLVPDQEIIIQRVIQCA